MTYSIFLSTFFCIWTGNFIFVNFSRILFLWLYFIFYKLLIVSKYTLCTEHCVKFHQIFWCGNFVEKHGFHIISGESPFHKISTPGNKVKLRYLCIEESKSCLSYRILYFYLFRWFINLICRAIYEINFCIPNVSRKAGARIHIQIHIHWHIQGENISVSFLCD